MAPARYHEPGMYISYTNTGQNIRHFLPGSLLLYTETSISCARDRPLGLVWFGLVWQYQTNPTSEFVWFLLFASLLRRDYRLRASDFTSRYRLAGRGKHLN